jgi:plastocyanin
MARHRSAVVPGLAAAFLALSCFSSDSTTGPEDGTVTATVDMTSQARFSPAAVTVRVGEAVEWRNTANGVAHTATLDPAKAQNAANVALPAGAQTFDSGSLSPGATYRHTFRVAGTYRYFCMPHETFGMVGTVTVLP